MESKCPNCTKKIDSRIGTYRFKESGLNNVYLENVPIFECGSCGISYAAIFRIGRLNELIANTLLEKPVSLTGKEIRFLRKSIRLSSSDFADLLAVDKTTFSKWENNQQRHTESNDRHIRLQYLIHEGVAGDDARSLVSNLTRIYQKKAHFSYSMLAKKIDDDYIIIWIPYGGKTKSNFTHLTHRSSWSLAIATQVYISVVSAWPSASLHAGVMAYSWNEAEKSFHPTDQTTVNQEQIAYAS